MKKINRTISVAPMMDWTDRFCRYFLRLISQHTLLYTEMITTGAILHGDRDRFLKFDPIEHPVALQLGGSNAKELSQCAKICEDYGYDEINLNIGCPSDRVQNGKFGACLMAEPDLVADCVAAMQKNISIPVTVKTRIGIDDQDNEAFLHRFVEKTSAAGCTSFTIHARKAWLTGLSPKQNRDIPPLNYDRVYQLKKSFPDLEIIINGGITRLDEAQKHLDHIDGVMIGRAAYQTPYILAEVDRIFYNDNHPIPTRHDIIEKMMVFIQEQLNNDIYLNHITRHIINLFHEQPGARGFRRHISENAHKPGANIDVIKKALEYVA